ncbi:hypothetical protein LTR85_007442 [Meristemomyces frigidus]|nr:hypothetical protein LTR85_007442 [Meristemomyces frigidus]
MAPSPSPSTDEDVIALLYEGEYAEWRPGIDELLRRRNLLGDSLTDWQSAKAADLIAEQVHPAFLERAVPFSKRCFAASLLQRLEEATGLFRFLDLPPELRIRVYEFLLRTDQLTRIRCRRPPVTLASQQLRGEALPIYFSVSRFRVDFDTYTRSLERCMGEVKQWAALVTPAGLKAVREVTLGLMVPGGRARRFMPQQASQASMIEFVLRCDPTGGLSIACPDRLSEASKIRVETHARTMDENRKVLGVNGGGAMVMALITDNSLWKLGELDYEWSS